MLSQDILTALAGYTENLQSDVTFALQTGEHAKRAELLEFLDQFCGVSPRLSLIEREAPDGRSPLTFDVEVDGTPSGVRFSGIPSGHEFNSLVLAVLHAGGTEMKLDAAVQDLVRRIDAPLAFETFVSLSCHNCPDVVQALNQFALLNPAISAEMIDGGLFQELIDARDVQGVPTVFLNGELFASGKVDAAGLLDKLIERFPALREPQASASLPLQDVTVIGGGPAGVSAAIYAARKGVAVTLIAERMGGQVKDTMSIENLISVNSTTGPELVSALQGHMADYDITIKENLRVDSVELDGEHKSVLLSTGERVDTRTLIVATGARWRELGVPGEKENLGNGVAYCPHCDGPFFKGKDVAVIGGGNSGIEAALDLAGITRHVTVFEFLPELKADQVLIDQARARANIDILTNVATQRIEAEAGKVSGITYADRASDEVATLGLDGVFVQIGLLPNSQCVDGQLELTRHKEIVIDEKCRTSVDGVYACGDVTTVPYKQISVAMGEGAKAALAAFEYLLTAVPAHAQPAAADVQQAVAS
ncbi:MAG: alkyl hydroperoxide reductase subunit F [Pseudomonadota bacterium]